MATPQDFAASFARTLDLFRDPGAKEQQKAQFRTLAGILKVEGVAISAQDGRLLVNGAPVDSDTLLQRLEFHSVKEIAIPADPPLAEMFELLRALADQPGDEDISSRLRGSGATRISVRMQTFAFGTPITPVTPARLRSPATPRATPDVAPVPPPPVPTPIVRGTGRTGFRCCAGQGRTGSRCCWISWSGPRRSTSAAGFLWR